MKNKYVVAVRGVPTTVVEAEGALSAVRLVMPHDLKLVVKKDRSGVWSVSSLPAGLALKIHEGFVYGVNTDGAS